MREVRELMKRGTLKVILKEDLQRPHSTFCFGDKIHRRQPAQVQGALCDGWFR